MKKLLSYSCTPCIGIGSIIFFYSTNAFAQNSEELISYKWLLGSMLGAFILLIGAYVRGVRDGIEERHRALKQEVRDIDLLMHSIDRKILIEYPSKVDMRNIISSELRIIRSEMRILKRLLKLPQDEREDSQE